MPKYRVAVIGRTGKGNYGHALDTVWLKCDKAEIVAVADENNSGRVEKAKTLGAKNSYADYREMLKKEKPQIVSVADRWLDCHHDMVIACAEHGAHIFLEKPAARTLQEADAMIDACDKTHVRCAIAHQTRYSPGVKVIKDLIAEGKIGDVLELRAHGKEDTRGGGQDLMILGTHTFDLMRYLVGDALWCSAQIRHKGAKAVVANHRVEGGEGMGPILGDHIVATFGFAGPTVGRYFTHVARAGAGSRYWLEIRGTLGVIQVGYGIMPPAFLCEDPSGMFGRTKAPWKEITSAGVGRPETLDAKALDNGNILIVNDLIAAIEQRVEPLGSLRDGRAALEMIMSIYASHAADRVVELPLKNRKHPLAVM